MVGHTPVADDDFAVARYNPNGTLDTTFSGDGKQTTDFGGYEQANAVAIQLNGKIVVVGYSANNSTTQGAAFALARYNPNGSLDTSFSGDGKQAIGSDFDSATAVAIQANGKIVAVGICCGYHGGEDFAIARFNLNGSLDPTFGFQTTSFRDSNGANAVAIQPNGKIVVAGDTTSDIFRAPYNYALARYNTNGTLDTTFSGDGKQATSIRGQANGVGHSVERKDRRGRQRPRSPATTRTVRVTRASRETEVPTSAAARTRWSFRRTAGSSWSAAARSPATTRTVRVTRASRETEVPTSTAARTRWSFRRTAGSSWLASPADLEAPATPTSSSPAIWGVDQGAGCPCLGTPSKLPGSPSRRCCRRNVEIA